MNISAARGRISLSGRESANKKGAVVGAVQLLVNGLVVDHERVGTRVGTKLLRGS